MIFLFILLLVLFSFLIRKDRREDTIDSIPDFGFIFSEYHIISRYFTYYLTDIDPRRMTYNRKRQCDLSEWLVRNAASSRSVCRGSPCPAQYAMSLAVEVAGFGLCQTASPYSILVICVQQETFQAWTVYRRYSSFVSLAEQLQILHPSIPNVPKYNPDNLSMDNLDHCRSAMDNWWDNSYYSWSLPAILQSDAKESF